MFKFLLGVLFSSVLAQKFCVGKEGSQIGVLEIANTDSVESVLDLFSAFNLTLSQVCGPESVLELSVLVSGGQIKCGFSNDRNTFTGPLSSAVPVLSDYLSKFSERSLQKTCNIVGCSDCFGNDCSALYAGYFKDQNSSIFRCSVGCMSCVSQASCQSCFPAYTLSNSSCIKCPRNCLNCTNGICTGCYFGYFALNGYCFSCMTGCYICKNATNCGLCLGGYYMNTQSICIACPTGCARCNNSTCLASQNGYYIDATGFVIPCMTGCSKCKTVSQCTLCKDGYVASVNGKCLSCPSNCLSCSDPKTCVTCNNTYYLTSSNNCLPCKQNCQICTTESICSTCNSGYYFNNILLACSSCKIGCAKCSSSTCFKCSDIGFMNNSNCSACPNGADQCEGALICARGFYLKNNTCVKCDDGCFTCYNGQCTGCFDGYYLDGSCKRCPQGCKACISSTCSLCLEGFYIQFSTCVPCFYPCSTCVSLTNCTSCASGYFLNNYTCSSCSAGSQICLNKTYSFSCKDGYYLSQVSCIACISNCRLCEDSSSCLACFDGFSLSDNCVTALCPTGCSACSNSICTKCLSAYYLAGSNCVACSSNCLQCDSSQCFQCQSGYMADNKGFCQSCYLLNCYCTNGYYLNTGFTCYECPFGCALCSSIGTCQVCSPGFFLNSMTCEACSAAFCTLCLSDVCSQCQDRYYLDKGICFRCGMYCKTCRTFDTCDICDRGFELFSSSYCIPCPGNCSTCSSGVCSDCLPGFMLSDNTCSQTIQNCLIYSQNTCSYCASGYTEINGMCANCTGIYISQVLFDQFFQNLVFTFNRDIEKTDPLTCDKCKNVLYTTGSIGYDCSCYSSGNQFVLQFNQWYSVTMSTVFYVKTEQLFNYVCYFDQLILEVYPTYTVMPSVPSAVIKGATKTSINCSDDFIGYNVADVVNSYGFSLNYTWIASTSPLNSLIENYVMTVKDNSLIIPNSLFTNQNISIFIQVELINVLQIKGATNFTSNIYAYKLIETEIDVASYLNIDYSKSYIITGRVSDLCKENSAIMKWTLGNTKMNSFSGGYPHLLYIAPYSLQPLTLYHFNFTAYSGNILGFTELDIYVNYAQLVLMLSLSNCSVSTDSDLNISTKGSFNPNDNKKASALIFTWMYCTFSNNKCLANSNFTQTGDTFKLNKTSLPANGTVWIFTVFLSSDNSNIPGDKKVFKIEFLSGVGSNIGTYLYSYKQEIVSYGLLLQGNVSVFGRDNVSVAWVIPNYAAQYKFVGSALPWLYMYPKASDNVDSYMFVLKGVQKDSYSYANISFDMNQPATCLQDSLTIDPPSGTAFDTIFYLNINSCTDIDYDFPILYRFSIKICDTNCVTNFTSSDPNVYSMYYQVSIKKQFNYISAKMPPGVIKASAQVCDQLGGCSAYKIMYQVNNNTNISSSIITNYIVDIFNPDLIPFYAIMYIRSFNLTSDEFNYIYQSFYSYLKKMKITSLDVIHILLTYIYEMFGNSNQFLDTGLILQYINDASTLVSRHSDPITDQDVQNTLTIIYKVLNSGIDIESSPSVIIIVMNFAVYIFKEYAVGRLPGDMVIDYSTSIENMTNFQYFKYRDTAQNILNRVPDSMTSILKYVSSIPVSNQTIVNIDLYKFSFPDGHGIIAAHLTESGFYYSSNLTFVPDGETAIDGDSLSFYVFIDSISDNQICLYYNGNKWVNGKCLIDSNYSDDYSTGMLVSTGSYYMLEDSNLYYQTGPVSFGPIVLATAMTSIAGLVFVLLVYLEKKKSKLVQKKKKSANEDPYSTSNLIFKHFLILSFFSKDPEVNKRNNLLHLIVILNVQMAIDGLFFAAQLINDRKWSVIVGTGFIAPLFTIPYNVLATYKISPEPRWKYCLFVGVWIGQLVIALMFTFIFNIVKTTGQNSEWISAFFIGLVCEIFIEILVMIWKNIRIVHDVFGDEMNER